MFAIGNEELKEDIGEFIKCPECGKEHKVEYGEKILKDGSKVPSKLIGFYKCNNKTYLASIAGKRI